MRRRRGQHAVGQRRRLRAVARVADPGLVRTCRRGTQAPAAAAAGLPGAGLAIAHRLKQDVDQVRRRHGRHDAGQAPIACCSPCCRSWPHAHLVSAARRPPAAAGSPGTAPPSAGMPWPSCWSRTKQRISAPTSKCRAKAPAHRLADLKGLNLGRICEGSYLRSCNLALPYSIVQRMNTQQPKLTTAG